jgi:hypothetical protein
MSKVKSRKARALRVVVAPRTKAERASRMRTAGGPITTKTVHLEAIAGGFQPKPQFDLHDRGGKIIPDLVFTNFYVGGQASWQANDIQSIDQALSAAMSDVGLNNVMVQYFRGAPITSSFRPSRVLPGTRPAKMSQAQIEHVVSTLHASGDLDTFKLDSTVFSFMLPRGTVLSIGNGSGAHGPGPAEIPVEDQENSLEGLGGFHGSVHAGAGVIYYAVGVFSEGNNGIVAFDQPWKNVVATFYHELNEARTDADVEDAGKQEDESLIGWTDDENPGEEIGDIPMTLAASDLSLVMKEVPLAQGGGKVPIQLMWSNAVHGPEGPVNQPRQPTH